MWVHNVGQNWLLLQTAVKRNIRNSLKYGRKEIYIDEFPFRFTQTHSPDSISLPLYT